MKFKMTFTPFLSFLFLVYAMNPSETMLNDLPLTIPADISEKTMSDISYGDHPLQTMDIYLPKNRMPDSTKFIVMIHGGGWHSGNKSDLTPYIDNLKKRLPGYAFFNINYRLATNIHCLFPAQENDVKAAIEFIQNKAGEYRISNKFVLLGLSAGAHLALLQGYKNSNSIKPKAIISFFGPTDLIEMYNNPANPYVAGALVSLIGKTPAEDPLLYVNSSPINFIDANSPPTIVFHGGLDQLVKSTQSVSLANRLKMAGVKNKMVLYPREGHGWHGENLADSFNKIEEFLKATGG